jgi:hypothetical protein
VADKDKTYYAWSTFQKARDEWGRVTERVMPGEEVSASSLGVTDEEFKDLVSIGAVRSTEYPVPEGSTASPVEHLRAEADRIASGSYDVEATQAALVNYTEAATPGAPVVDEATLAAEKEAAKA